MPNTSNWREIQKERSSILRADIKRLEEIRGEIESMLIRAEAGRGDVNDTNVVYSLHKLKTLLLSRLGELHMEKPT